VTGEFSKFSVIDMRGFFVIKFNEDVEMKLPCP
jgi:hypothetical protein